MKIQYSGEIQDYYDFILLKYYEMKNICPEDKIQFFCDTIILVMRELKHLEISNQASKRQIQKQKKITENVLILLLLLFQGKEEESEYTNFCDLENWEKSLVVERQKAMLVN